MGTASRAITENASSSNKSNWTVRASLADITITDSVKLPALSSTAMYSGSGKNRAKAYWRALIYNGNSLVGFADYQLEGHPNWDYLLEWASGAWKTLSATSDYVSGTTIYASSFFTSSNPTVRTVPLTLKGSYWYLASSNDSNSRLNSYYDYSGNQTSIGTIANITLNAPPTYKVVDSGNVETTSVWFDTAYVYAGFTTASIRVKSLSAKYGGYISKIQFTIGAQSAVLNFDSANPPGSSETLSIPLAASGTFTPTVTVTDSRGQTTTTTLSSITVNAYSAPSVSFAPERTKSTGVPDDEGTYAAFPATFTFTDAVATLAAPTVVLIDEGGTQSTPTVNWYSSRAADGTLSGSVTWANLSSGDTVYGRVSKSGGLSTQQSYQIKITPNDDLGTGTPITQTLAPAFYTVDFYAGGHGIAFGKPATDEGFECAMDATFEDNVFIDLPEYTTADTTDKAIYDAIVALGWDSDVLVN